MRVSMLFVVFSAVTSCGGLTGNETSGARVSSDQHALTSVPSLLSRVQSSALADPDTLATAKMRQLLAVLLAREVSDSDLAGFESARAETAPTEPVNAVLRSDPAVAVEWNSRSRYSVTNGSVATDYVTTKTDIGQQRAGSVFLGVFDQLADSGVIARDEYELGAARVSPLTAAEGDSTGNKREWVNEYIFEVPRVVEGIEVLDASLIVAVHRNGSISRAEFVNASETAIFRIL